MRLAELTTLRLGGLASRVVAPETEAELVAFVRDADARREPLLVVGGGSNLVVGDDGWEGTVVRIVTRGVEIASELVTAAAGEGWDDFVTQMTSAGRAGVECLAGIPGLVGATPMQNVGAYGQDVGETIVQVRAWDRKAGELVTFDRAACGFAYRHSVFRGSDAHVLLSVTFALPRRPTSAPLRYQELTRALGIAEAESAPLTLVRDTVVALRRKKGMVLDAADPDTASAGSFFTNPILDEAALAALEARTAGMALPKFPEPGGRTKVSAAWLIEQAGFTKGFTKGSVAVSSKHSLALTNRGGATTAELLVLAREIRAGVASRFGVRLENEPVMVGVEL